MHCALNTAHCTVHIAHCIWHTAHYTLYNTLYTPLWKRDEQVTVLAGAKAVSRFLGNTLHSTYFTLHTSHSTLYTLPFTLVHILHFKLYTIENVLHSLDNDTVHFVLFVFNSVDSGHYKVYIHYTLYTIYIGVCTFYTANSILFTFQSNV